MQEYVTRAVVLDKEPRNNQDARYFLFTERYGKIAARAKSSRKIVSKLAGHLEPGTISSVRVIEQHGSQVVDALKIARARISVGSLSALNNLLGEWEPDAELWQELMGVSQNSGADIANAAGTIAPHPFSWANVLTILGWDPSGAVCVNCGGSATGNPAKPARYFNIPRQEFFCAQCAAASRFVKNDLILVS